MDCQCSTVQCGERQTASYNINSPALPSSRWEQRERREEEGEVRWRGGPKRDRGEGGEGGEDGRMGEGWEIL